MEPWGDARIAPRFPDRKVGNPMTVTACAKCGSKRTTEIAATPDRPASIWCHSCGAVLTKPIEPDDERAADRLLVSALAR